jgi:geranylgeranyl diphosphate synthase type I
MSFQSRDVVTVDEYVHMVTGKTAALIGASTAIGAMVATGDKDVAERFRLFGREIGIAFQVQDDILGIWGDPKLTGKSARNDIRNKKKTIPVLYAMEVSGDRDELKRIYAKPSLSDADIDRVFDILTKAGALEYTKSMAMKYKNDGMARLDGLCEGSKAMEKLRTVGRFLVERDY